MQKKVQEGDMQILYHECEPAWYTSLYFVECTPEKNGIGVYIYMYNMY